MGVKLKIPKRLTHKLAGRAMAELHPFFLGAPVNAAAFSIVRNWKRFRTLWWDSQIMGLGLAEKLSDGCRTGVVAVRVYVRRKLARARLAPAVRIPRSLNLSGDIRVVTDVVELRDFPVAEAAIPIGHFSGLTEGTLGPLLLAAGDTYGLTCRHVAAPVGHTSSTGDAIESPPDRDGLANHSIGQLFSWTALDRVGVNVSDAALVKLDTVGATNAGLGLSASSRFRAPLLLELSTPGGRGIEIHSHW